MKAPGSWHVPLRHQISSIQHLPVTLQLLPVPTMLPFISHRQPCAHRTRESFPILTSLPNSLIKVTSVLNATEQDLTRPYFPCLWCSGCSDAFWTIFLELCTSPNFSHITGVALTGTHNPQHSPADRALLHQHAPIKFLPGSTKELCSHQPTAPPLARELGHHQQLHLGGHCSDPTRASGPAALLCHAMAPHGASSSSAIPFSFTKPPLPPWQQVLFSSCKPSSFSFKTTPLFVPGRLHYSFIFLFCCLLIF